MIVMTKPEKAGLQDLYFFGSEQEVSEDYVIRNSKHSWTSHFPCGEKPCSINIIIIIIIISPRAAFRRYLEVLPARSRYFESDSGALPRTSATAEWPAIHRGNARVLI